MEQRQHFTPEPALEPPPDPLRLIPSDKKAVRERAQISVKASLIFYILTHEGDDTHGVKVQVQQGDDLLWKEVDVEVTIANAGLQALQIDCVFIETSTHIFQVTPSGLPVVLDPNRGSTVRVQPEFFAPSQLDLPTDTSASPTQSVILVGVIDALGNKHTISSTNLASLVKSCTELPLRIYTFAHKVTGNLIRTVVSKDTFRIIKKGSDETVAG